MAIAQLAEDEDEAVGMERVLAEEVFAGQPDVCRAAGDFRGDLFGALKQHRDAFDAAEPRRVLALALVLDRQPGVAQELQRAFEQTALARDGEDDVRVIGRCHFILAHRGSPLTEASTNCRRFSIATTFSSRRRMSLTLTDWLRSSSSPTMIVKGTLSSLAWPSTVVNLRWSRSARTRQPA